MHVCVCVCVCVWRTCVRIFQLFQFQVAYRMKNGMCVYMIVCVHVCVCMCVANGCTYMFDSLGSEGVKGKISCSLYLLSFSDKCVCVCDICLSLCLSLFLFLFICLCLVLYLYLSVFASFKFKFKAFQQSPYTPPLQCLLVYFNWWTIVKLFWNPLKLLTFWNRSLNNKIYIIKEGLSVCLFLSVSLCLCLCLSLSLSLYVCVCVSSFVCITFAPTILD